MKKHQIKFPIKFEERKLLKEMVTPLPPIPFMIPGKNGEPVTQKLIRGAFRKGSEIIEAEKDFPEDQKQKVNPELMYTQQFTIVRMQDHNVAIRKAFEQYGEQGAQGYCDQVWEYYYALKNLEEAPKELELGAENLEEAKSIEL